MKTDRQVNPGSSVVRRVTITLSMIYWIFPLCFSEAAPFGQPGEVWTIAPFELRDEDLGHGGSVLFQPTFEPGYWSGDLVQRHIDADGNMTEGDWSARSVFSANEAASTDYWTQRNIITRNAEGEQVPFLWSMLTSEMKRQLDPGLAASDGDFASSILNYLRGDRSSESRTGFRKRLGILGDITGSNVVYVGIPRQTGNLDPASKTEYALFRQRQITRPPRLYTGANDGMLHAFDAETGDEIFAYVPSILDFGKLATLVQRDYRHTAFLDGQLVVADVPVAGEWKTLLAGGLGAGGKGFFVLDVTSAEFGNAFDDVKILAEYGPDDADLGEISGAMTLTRLEDGEWYIVTGNGPGSVNGNAVLYLVPVNGIGSGELVQKIRVPGEPSGGLSSPALVDSDGNGKADTAYAGDIAGNLWKFDLAQKKVEKEPLFKTGGLQPIALAPEVGLHPAGGYMVYFATGQTDFLESSEAGSLQSLYAVHDSLERQGTLSMNDLIPASETRLVTVNGHGKELRVGGAFRRGKLARGWRLDLARPGERLLHPPVLRGGRLHFISTYPDPQKPGGMPLNWLMEIDWLGGGSSGVANSDYNGDGLLSEADAVTHVGEKVFPVGEYLGEGFFSGIRFARLTSGQDAILLNGLRVVVPDGLDNGHHFDVDSDTWSHGLGGKSARHSEAYDKRPEASTRVNYFAMKDGQITPVDAIREAGKEGMPFLITLANADLTPAAEILIATEEVERQWSVIEYQGMIQELLQSWEGIGDPAAHFRDKEGFPLLFTLEAAAPEHRLTALWIHLDPYAVSKGGIHATLPECVNRDASVTNDRWRNGALTLQLITAESLAGPDGVSGEKAWQVQHPDDMSAIARGYGGVRASLVNDSGFLYESIIYWHYAGKFCYGEQGWAEEVLAATGTLTESTLYSLFHIKEEFNQDSIEKVMQLVEEISSLECAEGSGFSCQEEELFIMAAEALEQLLDFQELSAAAEKNGGMLELHESGLFFVEETSDESRVIKPKRPPQLKDVDRRRSWIDLEPKS